jgi:hypothetical protein
VGSAHDDRAGLRTDAHGVFDRGRFRIAWIRDPGGEHIALVAESTVLLRGNE